MKALIEIGSLSKQPVVPHLVAMIRGEDEQGPLKSTLALQKLHDTADLAVNFLYQSVVHRPQLALLTDAGRVIRKRNALITGLLRYQLAQVRVLLGLFLWRNRATKIGARFGSDDRIVWSRRDIGGMRAHEA